jgi:hypothetical protein
LRIVAHIVDTATAAHPAVGPRSPFPVLVAAVVNALNSLNASQARGA